MRADGREAVEKVLRPSVEKHLREDVRVLAKVVGRVRAVTPVPRGVEEAGATYVAEEADFVREAANTKKIDKALRAYAKNAVVAKMRVRTTETYGHGRTHIQEERVRGLSLEELSRLAEDLGSLDALAQRHGLTDAERDAYVTLAKKAVDVRLQAFDALAYQYFQADAFHADPHAGNVMVTPKGELVFIDNGSIGETAQADRNLLKKFFLGFALQRPRELRTAVQGLAGGLKEEHLDAIVEIARSPLGDTDKLRQILVVVTERAEKIHPAFDKFLKSFATGAYLMAGLKPDDVRLVLGAYTQGDSGSLLSYAAASAARAARENPTSLVARTVKAMMES
jgi:predicted unusual protein kinase regulating ubiquinone biosynthesis (AarF/ABC1/UbiB family)